MVAMVRCKVLGLPEGIWQSERFQVWWRGRESRVGGGEPGSLRRRKESLSNLMITHESSRERPVHKIFSSYLR